MQCKLMDLNNIPILLIGIEVNDLYVNNRPFLNVETGD
jgi:hypothetical protein